MDGLRSNIAALKELLTIIYGVAVATIVESAIELAGEFEKPRMKPAPFDTPGAAGFLALGIAFVMLTVRFFHGNIRSLDDDGGAPDRLPLVAKVGQAGTLIAIVTQGAILGSLGKLLRDPELLWYGLWALFIADIALVAVDWVSRQELPQRPKAVWIALTLFSLLSLEAQRVMEAPFCYTIVALIVLSTVVDYWVNWSFYFPAVPEPPAAT
jgi:hypothetical protein